MALRTAGLWRFGRGGVTRVRKSSARLKIYFQLSCLVPSRTITLTIYLMALFRNYDQPSQLNPQMHIPQAVSSKRRYPEAVKKLCAEGSEGRMPNFPSRCPRCKQVAMFTPRLCYKLGIAGAWALVVATR